ncbi:DUF4179 domain-containing protein [Robertmurraya kyonggiensis]|uniref:DUF4179 domain-containing protein n=1 Tax=Robertmurraya kyonggiensis TaxID=1037680 RepID=A0A4U1CZG5_9BACI|nr:DUF4179 domain-containing protein [Robertmurraya kyonggiensis]TKC15292.1 DUF4179 domain-containing protein [Robertmurraya kyonggiensis]
MDKLQREIKSMVDHVSVPTKKVNDTVQAALLSAKKSKNRSFNIKHNIIVGIASVFVLAIGALLFSSYSPGFGIDGNRTLVTPSPEKSASKPNHAAIPYSDSIFFNKGDEGLKRMALEGNTQNISLASEDKGIKVILEEGYIDNQRMAISLRLDPISSIETDKETNITMDLIVNGESKGTSGFGGLNTEELVAEGNIIQFTDLGNLSTEPEIEIKIQLINEIEGNWSFSFDMPKEEEDIQQSDIAEKTDKTGNRLSINEAHLTPSLLKLNTTTSIKLEENMPENSFLFSSIVAFGPDGVVYFSRASGSYSNGANAYDPIISERTKNETIEIPRGNDAYSFKIVPYIVTFNGVEATSDGNGLNWNEFTAPFQEGAILDTDSKIRVEKIIHDNDKTVVYYEMDLDPSLPRVPTIINHETVELFKAISYKKQDNLIEVTYPKVENPESLELFMDDASYKVFSDLAIEFDLR